MIKHLIRVLRGGSWLHFPSYLRASVRNWLEPDGQYYGAYGFRLVVRIKEE